MRTQLAEYFVKHLSLESGAQQERPHLFYKGSYLLVYRVYVNYIESKFVY